MSKVYILVIGVADSEGGDLAELAAAVGNRAIFSSDYIMRLDYDAKAGLTGGESLKRQDGKAGTHKVDELEILLLRQIEAAADRAGDVGDILRMPVKEG